MNLPSSFVRSWQEQDVFQDTGLSTASVTSDERLLGGLLPRLETSGQSTHAVCLPVRRAFRPLLLSLPPPIHRRLCPDHRGSAQACPIWPVIGQLLSLRFSHDRRFRQDKHDDLFAYECADVVMQTDRLRSRDLQNDLFEAETRGFDELGSDLL